MTSNIYPRIYNGKTWVDTTCIPGEFLLHIQESEDYSTSSGIVAFLSPEQAVALLDQLNEALGVPSASEEPYETSELEGMDDETLDGD